MAGDKEIPDHSIKICADRGGTFCDLYASYPDLSNPGQRKELIVKLLSEDPSNYKDAPTEGIRRILETVTNTKIPADKPIPTSKIHSIRLSTTIATNALLTRSGSRQVLLTTKGFKDLLVIGNQSRPKIFDLNIRRPKVLFDQVVEIDERVSVVGFEVDPEGDERAVQFGDDGKVKRKYKVKGAKEEDIDYEGDGPGEVVRGTTGEAIRIIQKPDAEKIRSILHDLYHKEEYRSLSILFLHSYTYPHHEQLVASIAEEIGFTHISMSASIFPMIKAVPRGLSCVVDAYLTPVLKSYLDGFFKGFDESLRNDTGRVEFMSSDGGLVDLKNFNGLKSILSGPAGGVVGYARTTYDPSTQTPVIGIDIGGTSTDVSIIPSTGRLPLIHHETTISGISLFAPQLDINTVAAGGGSCLKFIKLDGGIGRLEVGPESSGANPGPVCYRKGGPLSLTDANLFLGRIIPEYFPKIFGESGKESLDAEGVNKEFQKLGEEVRTFYGREKSKDDVGDLDDIVYGFIKVANETMCRPIRALTESKGYDMTKHMLASFGGAGGQHACEIAQTLGIKTVLVHRYSSVLSAYGLGLADRTFDLQEPSSTIYSKSTHSELMSRLDELEKRVIEELSPSSEKAEKDAHDIEVERLLNMRYEGSDTALMILPGEDNDYEEAFKHEYKDQFGFLLGERVGVVVDDIKVRGIQKSKAAITETQSVHEELESILSGEGKTNVVGADKADLTADVYFPPPRSYSPSAPESDSSEGKGDKKEKTAGRIKTPVFLLSSLPVGSIVHGPSMILDQGENLCVVVCRDWKAVVLKRVVWIDRGSS